MISEQNLLLIRHMADGEFHSGETLGELLGISRAAIWKHLQAFADIGVVIERVRGRGYRINGGLSLLDDKTLGQNIPSSSMGVLDSIHVLTSTDSTNKYLLEKITQNERRPLKSVCLSEMQTAGRGRRGREWQSPFARNIYMSIAWPFESGIAAMEGLSLAVGVAVVEGLQSLGIPNVTLKWPNDVLYQGAKLGGVLIEIDGDVSGQCHAVIGLGLNVAMPQAYAETIDQAWIDLDSIVSSGVSPSLAELPSRNRIVAGLLTHLTELLSDYEQKGFASYRQRWESYAAHLGQEVSLVTPSKTTRGVMLGVSDAGAVSLDVDGECMNFVGGEISLRVAK